MATVTGALGEEDDDGWETDDEEEEEEEVEEGEGGEKGEVENKDGGEGEEGEGEEGGGKKGEDENKDGGEGEEGVKDEGSDKEENDSETEGYVNPYLRTRRSNRVIKPTKDIDLYLLSAQFGIHLESDGELDSDDAEFAPVESDGTYVHVQAHV